MTDRNADPGPVSGERLLAAALDAATSLIMIVSAHGALVRWNRACEELSGYTADELRESMRPIDLIPENEREQARKVLAALARGDSPVRVEFHWRTRTGELRLISWSNAALTGPDGQVTHVVATGIDVTERRVLEVRLRHLADHDALTGLINRRRFEEELEHHVARGRRYGMGGALLVLDLDGFKAINDNHGHRAGDRVLTAVAGTLKQRLRASDVVGRLGGDEFAVLLPHASAAEAEQVCQALERAISEEVAAPGDGPIEASIGFAPCTKAVFSIDDLMSAADASMYAVKAGQPRSYRRLRPID